MACARSAITWARSVGERQSDVHEKRYIVHENLGLAKGPSLPSPRRLPNEERTALNEDLGVVETL